jgi:hypothetical protein
MGDLLTRLTSFINFQKTVTVSVPGILLALAIVMLFQASRVGPPDTNLAHVFNPKGLSLPEDCNALSEARSPASGASGQLTKGDWYAYQNRRWKIEDCARQLQLLVLGHQSAVAAAASRIEAEQKVATDLTKQYTDYTLKGSSLAERYKMLADEKLGAVRVLRTSSKTSEGLAAAYNDMVTRLTEDKKAIDDRIRAGEQDEPLAGFITRLSDRLVYILILGTMLGLVMDPLVRQLQVLLYTDGRIARLNKRLTGAPVPTSGERGPTSNVNYVIGLGLITDADVTNLESRYGYTAQFGLGIIVPLILLLIGVGIYVDKRVSVRATESAAIASVPKPGGN